MKRLYKCIISCKICHLLSIVAHLCPYVYRFSDYKERMTVYFSAAVPNCILFVFVTCRFCVRINVQLNKVVLLVYFLVYTQQMKHLFYNRITLKLSSIFYFSSLRWIFYHDTWHWIIPQCFQHWYYLHQQ